jgi:hypothetical protein
MGTLAWIFCKVFINKVGIMYEICSHIIYPLG